jgi:hypothetical protein
VPLIHRPTARDLWGVLEPGHRDVDTVVVRSVLVTALNLDLGRWMWWPGRLSRELTRHEPEPIAALTPRP